MNKQEAIDFIAGQYPIDSDYSDTNEIGRQFMLEAMEETNFNWRDLPEEVLVRWAEKCELKEARDIRRFNEKYGS